MSKKKGKNSNYKVELDENSAPAKKGEPIKSFLEKNQNILIISLCAVLVIALVVGVVLVMNPRDDVFVEMDFGDYGKVLIEVDRNAAPITAGHFISLVEDGFYDGLTIYRGQPGFVIQGGRKVGAELEAIEGEYALNGYNNPISHKRGVISMVNDSKTSEFFITLDDSAAEHFDGAYAAFGYIAEGMDVVEKIAEELRKHGKDEAGFVEDKYAITIVSAKIVNFN